jgi:hypothetical protein
MKRVKDIFGELRDLADVAYEIYKSNDPYKKYTKEYAAANKLASDFQDSIAPELVVSLRKAQEWIRENHSLVYCGSNWTNCFGMEDALFKYVGFNRYRMDRERGEEEFRVEYVSPKEMIVDGYKYYKVLVDREADVLAAGGVDTERVFTLEDAISSMLLDLKKYDDQLESV